MGARRLFRGNGPAAATHGADVQSFRVAIQLPGTGGGMSYPEAVRWSEDGRAVDVLDQTLLPEREVRIELRSVDEVGDAISRLAVRGAPAIGIAAAMGIALDAAAHTKLDKDKFMRRLD